LKISYQIERFIPEFIRIPEYGDIVKYSLKIDCKWILVGRITKQLLSIGQFKLSSGIRMSYEKRKKNTIPVRNADPILQLFQVLTNV